MLSDLVNKGSHPQEMDFRGAKSSKVDEGFQPLYPSGGQRHVASAHVPNILPEVGEIAGRAVTRRRGSSREASASAATASSMLRFAVLRGDDVVTADLAEGSCLCLFRYVLASVAYLRDRQFGRGAKPLA